MTRLRRISGEKAIRTLEKLGFTRVRQRGSHVVLKRTSAKGNTGCVVPLHRQLAVGTLAGILRQAKVSIEEFTERL